MHELPEIFHVLTIILGSQRIIDFKRKKVRIADYFFWQFLKINRESFKFKIYILRADEVSRQI